jgi:hypothetical protein
MPKVSEKVFRYWRRRLLGQETYRPPRSCSRYKGNERSHLSFYRIECSIPLVPHNSAQRQLVARKLLARYNIQERNNNKRVPDGNNNHRAAGNRNSKGYYSRENQAQQKRLLELQKLEDTT